MTDRSPSISADELKKLKGKGLVETEELYEAGLKSGAFKKKDVVLLDKMWNRVERPPKGVERPFAIIVWRPTDNKDHKPSEEKVVSARTIYVYFYF
jgi:hypothetical protein